MNPRWREVGISVATILVVASVVWFGMNPGGSRDNQVFVYGTLLNPVVRAITCHCFVATEAATLTGYEKRGRTIVTSTSSEVRGAFINVSDWELAALDQYEGVPQDYDRQRLVIEGEPTWVYIENTD